jgi:hypothetical protein
MKHAKFEIRLHIIQEYVDLFSYCRTHYQSKFSCIIILNLKIHTFQINFWFSRNIRLQERLKVGL